MAKHPLAKSWDKWRESKEGCDAANPFTIKAPNDQRQYLENRLNLAFQAGCKAGEEYTKATDSSKEKKR